jgi:hypothetical protein
VATRIKHRLQATAFFGDPVNIYPFMEAEKADRRSVKGREGVLDQVPLAGEPGAANHQLGSGRHGDHIGHGHEVLACSSVGAAGSRGVFAVAGVCWLVL